MIMSVNVFVFYMKYNMFGQLYCRAIITENRSWIIFQCVPYPLKVFLDKLHGKLLWWLLHILLLQKTCSQWLFLRCPRDQICTQMESITKCAFPIIKATGKITVSVPCKSIGWCMSVPQAISKCACNISQYSFSNVPVRVFGRLHKSGNETKRIHQIKSSCSQIH